MDPEAGLPFTRKSFCLDGETDEMGSMTGDPISNALRSKFGAGSYYDESSYRVYEVTLPDVPVPVEIRVSAIEDRGGAIMEEEISLRKMLGNHPRIVSMVKNGTAADAPYYIVPRIPNLRERRRIKKCMSRVDVIRLVAEIAEALEWCHERDVVHLSVDPLSIKDDAGKFQLDGFSMAALRRHVSDSVWEQVVLGNPTYYSPELCFRKPVDFRSDIYSLGVVAYEAWSGVLPHHGTSATEILEAKTSRDPAPLVCATAWQKKAAGMIAQMLAREPSERPQSATAIREVACDILAGGLEQPGT